MDDLSIPTVAVVGAGASGTLVAAHLAASEAAAPFEILLIDPRCPGRGIAYSTTDPRHRLNVRAKDMSAWPTDPTHFLRWLHRNVRSDFAADGFASRCHYGQYLEDVLYAATAVGNARLHQVGTRAVDLRAHRGRLRITLADRTTRRVDAAVLALGHGKPSTSWAPAALRRSPLFVTDPWQPDQRAPRPRSGDDVVLVGTGLTAVDLAMQWAKPGVRVHLVSRHGMLPLPHTAAPAPCLPTGLPDGRLELRTLRRLVFDAIREADGDWRRAVDGLRPVTDEAWRRLPEPERRRFLAAGLRRWDRVRHRVAPEVSEWLTDRRRDGSLVVHAGGVVAAARAGRRIRVDFGDGSSVAAAAVVNCTGPDCHPGANADPLIRRLLAAGIARPGPLELGLATDAEGRLRTRRDTTLDIWTLGPLRRGELWETTAIPEIRSQAAHLSAVVVGALQGRPARHGLPAASAVH